MHTPSCAHALAHTRNGHALSRTCRRRSLSRCESSLPSRTRATGACCRAHAFTRMCFQEDESTKGARKARDLRAQREGAVAQKGLRSRDARGRLRSRDAHAVQARDIFADLLRKGSVSRCGSGRALQPLGSVHSQLLRSHGAHESAAYAPRVCAVVHTLSHARRSRSLYEKLREGRCGHMRDGHGDRTMKRHGHEKQLT